MAIRSYRGKHLLKPGLKHLLEGSISESTLPVVSLEFVHEQGVLLESFQVREDDVSFNLTGIAHTHVTRIGVHPLDCPVNLVRLGGERDGVPQRLAHLGLAIDTREPANPREDRLGFDQHIATDTVETPHEFVRLLDHRELIFAHGDVTCFEGGDISRLTDRVDQKTRRDGALETTLMNFFFHRRIAFEPGHRYQVEQVHGEFRELWYLRLDADC